MRTQQANQPLVRLVQLSRTGSGTPSDTSAFDARLSVLGRPSAEGSGEGLRQASEEAASAVEGGGSDAPGSAAPDAEAPSSPFSTPAAAPFSATEEAAESTAPPDSDDTVRSSQAAEPRGAPDEPAEGTELAESRGVEESEGHFTSTSQSTEGLLVRRDSRGHLSNSLSSKRVSMYWIPCTTVRTLVKHNYVARTSYSIHDFDSTLQGPQAIAAENVQVFDKTESPRVAASTRPGSGGSSRPASGNVFGEQHLAASGSSRSLVSVCTEPRRVSTAPSKPFYHADSVICTCVSWSWWPRAHIGDAAFRQNISTLLSVPTVSKLSLNPLRRALRATAAGTGDGRGSRALRAARWTSGRSCRTARSSASTALRT